MRPYTHTFLRCAAQDTWSTYIVPAGYRAVVTSCVATAPAGAGGIASAVVAGMYVCYWVFQAVQYTESFPMRAVAYGGQHIEGVVHSAYLTISGYLFEDATGATAAPGDHLTPDPQRALPWEATS